MGFRTNSYCTIWEVTPVSDTMTKARVSTSRKNRKTGEYETDFSGFVAFLGTAAAQKAARLKEHDRIRLGDVDVTSSYNKERKITYTNFNVYSFDMADDVKGSAKPANQHTVDDGEIDDSDPRLPF